MKNSFPCGKCQKNVQNDSTQCDNCQAWIHRRCARLSKVDLEELSLSSGLWFCECCNVFPFSKLDSDELFQEINAIENELMCLVNQCKHFDMEQNSLHKNFTFDADTNIDTNFVNNSMKK